MRPCLSAVLLFSGCLAAAEPGKIAPERTAEFGRGLSATEAATGWISLFDGKTDFGWSKADIDEEKGLCTGGATETAFPNCEVKGEAGCGGTILIGEREYIIAPGPFHIPETGGRSTIALSEKLALRWIAVRPRTLKSILPGPRLAGWQRIDVPKASANPTAWKMADGLLEAAGGPGVLEYPHEYLDLLLQVEVRTRSPRAKGGVLFRCIPGELVNGYEAAIDNACEEGDPGRPVENATGALAGRQNARRLVSQDKVPFLLTVIVDGTRMATWINGYQTVAWADTRPRDDNPRRGRRLEAGTIQLYARDAQTDLEFRQIAITELK